jgi:hypothetical protein
VFIRLRHCTIPRVSGTCIIHFTLTLVQWINDEGLHFIGEPIIKNVIWLLEHFWLHKIKWADQFKVMPMKTNMLYNIVHTNEADVCTLCKLRYLFPNTYNIVSRFCPVADILCVCVGVIWNRWTSHIYICTQQQATGGVECYSSWRESRALSPARESEMNEYNT